jgi:colanic acid/amylovoran biosynthesis glycosyltransferase
LENLGCPRSKIRVHPVAVDIAKFENIRTPRPSSDLKLISVARLVEKKGIEYSIRAVAALLRQGHRIEYQIIGQGELYGKLGSLIRELGVAKQIRLLGPKLHPEVSSHLSRADVFLAPSITAANGDEEGIPTCILEAMSSGLPVISTRHSGIPEVVQDGINGLLVPERDSEALAAAIARLACAPELCSELGTEGRKFIEQNRDARNINFRIQQLYEGLLAPHPSNGNSAVSKRETDLVRSPAEHSLSLPMN